MRYVLALALLAAAAGVRAESTVIRDTRLENLGATPVLGRGFTPAISALHGVCFEKLATTAPSFDLDYTFEEIERSASSARRETGRDVEIDDFVRDNSVKSTATSKRHAHHLLAVLSVESYYASLDESKAQLSEHALELLGRGDVAGFFSGCGTHYIRSVSRRSYFLTLFSYTSTQSTRDREFESRLEREVRKFAGAPERAQDQQFAEQARTRDLRVATRSIGLTARKNASLLPFDLASYKQGVKEAFLASQDEQAGRVVAMEITPWLSNTRVQVAFDRGGGTAEERVERRRILSDNSEFYIELVGALAQMNTQIHRAEACRRTLDQKIMEQGRVAPRFVGATAASHETGARIPLDQLRDAVSDASIDRMRSIALAWRDGPDGASGAQSCMLALEREGLSRRYHNGIPGCAWQRVHLPNARLVDEYCPPNLEPAGARPAAP